MLQRSIESLPDKYRDVLLLQIIGGYSGQEIADILEIPRATVNTRLFRARDKLRSTLDISPTKTSAKVTPLRVISK